MKSKEEDVFCVLGRKNFIGYFEISVEKLEDLMLSNSDMGGLSCF